MIVKGAISEGMVGGIRSMAGGIQGVYMSPIGAYAVKGAIAGSVVGGITGLCIACAGLTFELVSEKVGKNQNKNSIWQNPFVITPLACGAAGAAIGAITNVAMQHFSS